jgi:hypothetical protein
VRQRPYASACVSRPSGNRHRAQSDLGRGTACLATEDVGRASPAGFWRCARAAGNARTTRPDIDFLGVHSAAPNTADSRFPCR